MICRDSNGLYLGSSALVLKGISDPATLESLACRESLALAEDLLLENYVVASDCKGVISDIAEGTMGIYAAVIDEIKNRMRQFNNCSFVHEFRASNFEADSLAKFALTLGVGRHSWLNAPYSVNVPVNILLN